MSKTTLVRTSSSLTARGALLQVLARGPGFGAELVVRLKEITAGGVTIGYSSVYPPLRELEIDGLVRSFADPHPETKHGGHPRRFFELTALGLAEAEEQQRIIMLLLPAAPGSEVASAACAHACGDRESLRDLSIAELERHILDTRRARNQLALRIDDLELEWHRRADMSGSR